VDSVENVDAVFLHFAKAFDKVLFKRLMLTLKAHGISGKVALWLNNSHQRVGVIVTMSKLVPVINGSPQGSMLGRFLFLTSVILIAILITG